MTSRLAPEAQKLVRRHLRSVGELDLLMLLHEDPERYWPPAEICEVLKCPASWAEQRLYALRAAGIVAELDGRWRFATANPRLRAAADALAEACATRKADVVRLVFAQPSRDRPPFGAPRTRR